MNELNHDSVYCSLQQHHTGNFEISRGSDKSGYKQEEVERLVRTSIHIIVYVTQSAGSVEQSSMVAIWRMKDVVFVDNRGCADS